MAQTTTAFNAKNSVIQIDNASGTLTDISGSSISIELELSNEVGELTTFGTLWKVRTVAFKDATGSINVVGSTAGDEGFDLMMDWFFGGDDSARTIQIDFPDSNPGSLRITGEFVLENVPVTLDSGDANPVAASCGIMNTGAVTRETITS